MISYTWTIRIKLDTKSILPGCITSSELWTSLATSFLFWIHRLPHASVSPCMGRSVLVQLGEIKRWQSPQLSISFESFENCDSSILCLGHCMITIFYSTGSAWFPFPWHRFTIYGVKAKGYIGQSVQLNFSNKALQCLIPQKTTQQLIHQKAMTVSSDCHDVPCLFSTWHAKAIVPFLILILHQIAPVVIHDLGQLTSLRTPIPRDLSQVMRERNYEN